MRLLLLVALSALTACLGSPTETESAGSSTQDTPHPETSRRSLSSGSPARGQPARWIESGGSPSASRTSTCQRCSVRNGITGWSSRRKAGPAPTLRLNMISTAVRIQLHLPPQSEA